MFSFQDNKQGFQCQFKNSVSIYRVDELQQEYEEWFYLGQAEEPNGKIEQQFNFPPIPKNGCSEKLFQEQVQLCEVEPMSASQDIVEDQHILQQSNPSQPSEISKDESGPQAAVTKRSQKRKDAHDVAQNVGSKARSLACKLLAESKPKDWKQAITNCYNQFLKGNSVACSQIVVVYTYLFFVLNLASESIYIEFSKKLLEYLYVKWQNAQLKEEGIKRDGLSVKIKANIRLIQYLFPLKGQKTINFQQVKTICQPLFSGRQAKRIQNPLENAIKIQKDLQTVGGRRSPLFTAPSHSKTSNASFGCQVEL